MDNNFSYLSAKSYVVGTQKNHLNEHKKHMFKMTGKKIITILHSNNSFYYIPINDTTLELSVFWPSDMKAGSTN